MQAEFGDSVAKLGVDTVSRVGPNNAPVQVCRHRRADLIHGDLRLGLKLNLFGHVRRFPPLAILGPFLWQIQAIGDRQTGTPRRHRQTHRYPTVILLVRSTDVRLPPNAYLSLESRCHPRSRPSPVLASASSVTHSCAPVRAVV